MYSLTRCFNLILTILTISSYDSIKAESNKNEDMQVVQTSQWATKFPWDYILRESIFKTISPSPLANNPLYRRILNAVFYQGPLPIIPENNTSNIVLSQGHVYHLPNERWILCQEGCVNCEICNQQTYPILKWILRRIKRFTSYGSLRYDVQLTIEPQTHGNYHMPNLWPRTYIYVASQGEVLEHSDNTFTYADGTSAPTDLENNSSVRHGMTNRFSSSTSRHPTVVPEIDKSNISIGSQDVLTVLQEDSTTATISTSLENEQKSENKQRARHFRKARPTTTERSMNQSNTPEVGDIGTKDLFPQLILGTDQLGQKHLVHVVSTDNKTPVVNYPKNINNWMPIESTGLYNSSKPDYQQVLQKIFHSLVTHRRSIERFLQTPENKIGSRMQTANITGDRMEKEEKEMGHRVNGINPSIGFYSDYNEVNENHSSIGTVPPVVPDQSRERRRSISLINTTEISNSITNESQAIDGCFKSSAVTRSNDSVRVSNHRAERSVSDSIKTKVPTVA